MQVNGHSLGGSLAQLLSMKLLRDGIESKMIGIAGFRIGDADFASFYNSKTYDHFRIVNYKDFAAHLMHRFQGFKHTATEFYLE